MAEKFEEFLATVSDHGEADNVWTDDGGELVFDVSKRKYVRHRNKHEKATADSPQFNGVAEPSLGIIENSALAARIQELLIFPGVDIPTSENL